MNFELNLKKYGKQHYDPSMTLKSWRNWVKKEMIQHKGHLSVKGDPDCPQFFPGIPMPTKTECMKNGTYFAEYRDKGFGPGESLYNRTNHIDYGYIPKLARDDRKRIRDMDIAKEDNARPVPVRSSTLYGHYINNSPILPYISKDMTHRYRDEIRMGFTRNNGTGLKLAMQSDSDVNIQ